VHGSYSEGGGSDPRARVLLPGSRSYPIVIPVHVMAGGAMTRWSLHVQHLRGGQSVHVLAGGAMTSWSLHVQHLGGGPLLVLSRPRLASDYVRALSLAGSGASDIIGAYVRALTHPRSKRWQRQCVHLSISSPFAPCYLGPSPQVHAGSASWAAGSSFPPTPPLGAKYDPPLGIALARERSTYTST